MILGLDNGWLLRFSDLLGRGGGVAFWLIGFCFVGHILPCKRTLDKYIKICRKYPVCEHVCHCSRGHILKKWVRWRLRISCSHVKGHTSRSDSQTHPAHIDFFIIMLEECWFVADTLLLTSDICYKYLLLVRFRLQQAHFWMVVKILIEIARTSYCAHVHVQMYVL